MDLMAYRTSTDSNVFERLSDGERLNLLDEAIERISALEAIVAKLPKTKDGPEECYSTKEAADAAERNDQPASSPLEKDRR